MMAPEDLASVGFDQIRVRLRPGAAVWAGGGSVFTKSPSGEGAFRFDQATIGVVLSPLTSHHAAYGGDRRRAAPLLPGQGWLFPAGFEGWCRWDEPNDFLNVHIADDLLAEAGALPSGFAPRAGALDPLAAQLALNLHAADDAPRLYRDALGLALAAQIARVVTQPDAAPPVLDHRIMRAIDYIEAHLPEDISLDALAAVAAMSRFHFARSFRLATGLPPHAYLIVRRIERAKILLRSTRSPIADIAWKVGYANPAKFAAQFRRRTGTTPGRWRGG